MILHESIKLLHCKGNNRAKRIYRSGEIFANHTSAKRLIRYFSKEDI
jgi:hypothetical protein